MPVAEEAAIGAAAGARRGSRAPRKTRARTPILVVDDDPQMLRYVRDALAAGGYAPLLTGNLEELPGLVRTHRPRLVLLDLRLPGTDGIELMERIPELGDLPVIFISAYDRDETIVRALDAGAADYIVKPFSPTELTARVRAALRRRAAPEPFLLGELAIGYDERRVTVAGRPVELTATEFELLRVLSINAGQVVRYDSLMRPAWGGRAQDSGDPKLVRAVVKRLRRKLEDDTASRQAVEGGKSDVPLLGAARLRSAASGSTRSLPAPSPLGPAGPSAAQSIPALQRRQGSSAIERGLAVLLRLVSDGVRNGAELGRAGKHPVVQHPLYVRHVHGHEKLEDPRNPARPGLRLRLLNAVRLAEAANVAQRGQERPSFEVLCRAPDHRRPLRRHRHGLHEVHSRPTALGWPTALGLEPLTLSRLVVRHVIICG